MEQPSLFDRALIRGRLARAGRASGGAGGGAGPPHPLAARVAEDLQDRLAVTLRRFETAADLSAVDVGAGGAIAGSLALRSAPGEAEGAGGPVRVVSVRATPSPGASVVADADALPLGDASIDLAVSLLSLQAVDDLPGALVQINRALRPDGLFLAAMLGGSSLFELRSALAEAEEELTGGASPRVAPFVEVRTLGSLLQRAGFALPVVDIDPVVLRYDDMFGLLRDLRAAGLTNPLRERLRRPTPRGLLLRAAAVYAARFSDRDGRVRASVDVLWASGWRPHESQQKPLKPGSAKARLADALGARETSAGEAAPAVFPSAARNEPSR